MSVYIIAQIRIHDRAEYDKYSEGFLDVFARFQGELLVVSENPAVIEGSWPYTRTVLIRFPSAEEARRLYESPEYQKIAQHRFRASVANAVMVEALEAGNLGSRS
jgi:uncharacterized protein (DUF1330 family)